MSSGACKLCNGSREIELREGKGRVACPRCEPTLYLDELVRRYMAQIPPAVSGQGGHNQTLKAAIALVKGFDLSIDAARPFLAEYNKRCEPAWTAAELEHKLQSADVAIPDDRLRGWLRPALDEHGGDGCVTTRRQAQPPRPEPKAEFRDDKLRAFAARWRAFVDTAWLADRSAVEPSGVTSAEFLQAIFQPGEKAVVFTKEFSQGQALWPDEQLPTTGKNGVWFLANPVDGETYPNPRNLDKMTGEPTPSRRSEESVTSWRYLVLESDKANARDWAGALVQLPLAISAIYTSGGKSIHALIRVDARDLDEWRKFSAAVKPILVTLGGDQQVIASAVRLTRLPGCWREGKTKRDGTYERFPQPQLQKLLYLNPDPPALPICQLPRVRDVLAPLAERVDALTMCAADVIERACARNLDAAIVALQEYETQLQPNVRGRAELQTRLGWFESSPTAAKLLARLRDGSPLLRTSGDVS